MKPLKTSKAKTAAEQAEDRIVFDRPVILQQYSTAAHAWSAAELIHANVNKAVSTGGQAPSDSAHVSRYVLKMRYFAALNDVRSNLQFYRLIYNAETFEIADYDDYNERHSVVKLTASRIRTGTVTLISDVLSYDAIGQQTAAESQTVLPCTEYEATQEEKADLYQIGILLSFRIRIFRSEYAGQHHVEYGGKRYRIGNARYIGDAVDLYIGERIGEMDAVTV